MVKDVVSWDAERTEKITVNIGMVDLGEIDLLVREGFYANRTDFVRAAVRTQLASRSAAISQTVARKTLSLGTFHVTRKDLEQLAERGESMEIRVLGLATIADDITPELATATIRHVEVLGAFKAPRNVRQALQGRTV